MHRILVVLLAWTCLCLTWGCIQTTTPAARPRKVVVVAKPPVAVAKPSVTVAKPILPPLVYLKIERRLNAHDRAILLQVAKEEDLTRDQTNFLLTIRIIENGRKGLELGVGDGLPRHPARRYAGNHDKSLRLQGQWVAGAIKKRFGSKADMYKFAKRHCPLDTLNWYWNARTYMEET